MIIARIAGGLGNQMFRYAAARRLAYIHRTILKLDVTSYEKGDKLRKFDLLNFNINAEIATEEEIEEYVRKPKNIVEKVILALFPSLHWKNSFHYEEKFYHFDPAVLTLADNTYLSGYFQSEKYFKDIEDIIRKELTVKHHPDRKNQDFLKQIKSTNSVGIHVRRGDFATDVSTSSLHGLYGTDYFLKAISLISKKISQPTFYVFSDDPSWARDNLKVKLPITFIGINRGKKDYEDLRLMSSCKHNIIVNSTFGWWGAWLNDNKSKIIITPKKWYKREPVDTYDLIPESWIKI